MPTEFILTISLCYRYYYLSYRQGDDVCREKRKVLVALREEGVTGGLRGVEKAWNHC